MALHGGSIAGQGTPDELRNTTVEELQGLAYQQALHYDTGDENASTFHQNPQDEEEAQNPQDEEDFDENENEGPARSVDKARSSNEKIKKTSEAKTQTELTEDQRKKGAVVSEEGREAGHVKFSTYETYLENAGYMNFAVLLVTLAGIMIFQNLCNLWIAYWTAEHKHETFMYKWMQILQAEPPERPHDLLMVFGWLVLGFVVSNFAGHAMEIIGGIRAAHHIFAKALEGTLGRPFRWWDSNPTGRVLNRFSSDVEVMDLAVTNIFGVIIGAVLYFFGHLFVLTLASPASILLLPLIGLGMEFFAQYYRNTIREVQRLYLVSMSAVYSEMTEAIRGGITIRAFGTKRQVLSKCLLNLDELQRMTFAKSSLGLWVGLRMGCVGLFLTTFNQLYPVLQYYGLLNPRSAALVGFSMTYSGELVAIISQFVMNFSDLEMQLISIERLSEFAKGKECQPRPQLELSNSSTAGTGQGLKLTNVEVTYREGLNPALSDVSISFAAGEATAVVGRTGAGKSSLLLSVLQLVPHTGCIEVDGQVLGQIDPAEVRKRLVAVVPQQPVVFSGSLRFNLCGSSISADDQSLWKALEAVGLRSICNTKLGLDVQLSVSASEASKPDVLALSQGQKQLLCAARALLRSPKVVLLDEVTAALPHNVALSTAKTLNARFKSQGAAVLMVTHQEDLISACDRVVSIAGGRIVGDRRA
eukprot:TRINITY_DN21654_c0_g1_i2.p1 TRINITY_DN21654_c0_g1~~TRINITY_DN21654_c0_g1_i2.p1  ORF type:complete len:791 (-),score=169.62 TRINITY_DN21654_c0_g1_i2:135-2234(-)